MDGSHISQFFLEPKQTFQRQYEALRAVFVDGQPLDQVAQRFGYKRSALKSMACRLRSDYRCGVSPPFFSPTDADGHPGQAPTETGRMPSRLKSRMSES
jgi:hypothetical protein